MSTVTPAYNIFDEIFITVINYVPTLWTRDPNSIPPGVDGKRVIAKGPLINLVLLQEHLASGTLDVNNDDQFWPATEKSKKDLVKYAWSHSKVGSMLAALRPGRSPNGDYKKSEWCEVEGGEKYPCDVYVLPFDEEREQRNSNGLPIYLKFSVGKDGELVLVLVSCHI
ncbi:MAG: hypothetical protein WCC39_14250 [Telluria sp.]